MSHRHQIQGFQIPSMTTRHTVRYYTIKTNIKEIKSA